MSAYRVWDGQAMGYTETPSTDYINMMSTDEIDTTGQIIYECDIVQSPESCWIVEWEGHGFLLRCGPRSLHLGQESELKVIGNAFENPELI